MRFDGKVVLVTGASRGIGREVCRQFAAAGATVVVHYNQNLNEAVLTHEVIGGSPHLLLKADITDPTEVNAMVDRIVADLGRLDILVNNSAIFVPHEIATASYADWQEAWTRTIQTNLIGAANASFCAAQVMIRQGGGRIVNVSSRGAFRGEPGAPAYGASKA
ncbi:MAG: SDR family NAD(P)-dependent oxidoreductase, partial [Acidobacteria bacterium]|nr:SDR family NAD(P)-dependent oxidoreductase [Acidobacteriota bacterium]